MMCPAPSKHTQYDYNVEKRVLEQAKNRAISIAAEASLQMKEIERLRAANQLVESRDEESDESVENSLPLPQPLPRPPIIPGGDILKPTPVSLVGSTGQSSSESDETGQASSAGSESDGKNKIKASESDALKSLGQMSIREFEGDSSDPFEITSLQAINDMEILQTVLQPMTTPPATTTSRPCVAPPSTATTPVLATPPVQSGGAGLTRSTSSSGHLPSLAQPAQSGGSQPGPTHQPSPPTVAAVGPSLPVQIPQRASSSPQVGVASGSSPSNPFVVGPLPTSAPVQAVPVNPFYHNAPPTSVAVASPRISTNPFLPTSPPAVGPPPIGPPVVAGPPPPTIPPSSVGAPPLQASGVATLIDIGSSSSTPPGVQQVQRLSDSHSFTYYCHVFSCSPDNGDP